MTFPGPSQSFLSARYAGRQTGKQERDCDRSRIGSITDLLAIGVAIGPQSCKQECGRCCEKVAIGLGCDRSRLRSVLRSACDWCCDRGSACDRCCDRSPKLSGKFRLADLRSAWIHFPSFVLRSGLRSTLGLRSVRQLHTLALAIGVRSIAKRGGVIAACDL